MNEYSLQKCRTCLKSSTKTFSLTKQATGCHPRMTYGQLLKEYAKLEYIADYERLMPQYLCLLCCRDLRNTYAFIKQAHTCNNKLLNVIAKQFDCLQERIIDLPENANNLEVFSASKTEDNHDESEIKQEIKIKDNYSYKDTIVVHLVPSKANEMISERNESNGEMEMIENDDNDSNDLICAVNTTKGNLKKAVENFDKSQICTICPICGQNLITSNNLIKHLHNQHDIEGPSQMLHDTTTDPKEEFDCKLCSCKYTNKYTYLYHLKHKHKINQPKGKEKTEEKIIKCRSCDYTARTYSALNYHTRSKHGTENDKFKCKFCSYMSLKKFDLLTHVKNFHKELIKALRAEAESSGDRGDTLSDGTTLTISENKSLDDNEETCSSDDVPLIQKTKNKFHFTSNFSTKIPDNKEQFSDEDFIRNILNIKKRETKSSTKSLARRCDECGNIYKNYKALYAHQRHVHISEDKYSLCPHCGKKYKRKTDLRNHIDKSHIPKNSTEVTRQPAKIREKRFMCTECSYVCTTITILNIHINRHHTGEKPYKCDICFKSFIVPYDLKIHRYLHTGERPYKCPICSKGFRDNSHMIKHKRIHSSERPYKCKECNKSFTQSYNLSVHKRTHLKEKKLYCPICGKIFENRSLLNIHRINDNHHDEVL